MLQANGLSHHRMRGPHCPEENGLMERANRTLREGLEGEEPSNLLEVEALMARIVRRYNETRLHSALGYLPPAEFYRGDPESRFEEPPGQACSGARHQRRERNLELRQGDLPLEGGEAVSSH